MKRLRDSDDEQYTSSTPNEPRHNSSTPSSSVSLAAAQDQASREPFAKYAELDSAVTDDETDTDAGLDAGSQERRNPMKCSLPPHKEALTFTSYAEYETHYSKLHVHRCLECKRNFPSDHLLGVHIEECHDPLVVVRRDRGEHTYSCFVEGCERKCMTHQKRRMHLIDKHMYPKNYFFAVTKEGIDGRRSLLVEGGHHRRRSSTNSTPKETRRRASMLEATKEGKEPEKGPKATQDVKKDSLGPQDGSSDRPDTDMADLTGAMSALQFVPPSIRFGRGRAGFAKR